MDPDISDFYIFFVYRLLRVSAAMPAMGWVDNFHNHVLGDVGAAACRSSGGGQGSCLWPELVQ